MNQLSNEQHLTQEQLLRYVEDDCSRLEMREIDRHLTTCEMCSDAVEGLMLLSEPSVALDNLNTRIDKKIAEQTTEKTIEQPFEKPIMTVVKRPFWQQRWAAAAAVLLLASSSIWVYKNTQTIQKQTVVDAGTPTLPNSEWTNGAVIPPQYSGTITAKGETTTTSKIVEKAQPTSSLSSPKDAEINTSSLKEDVAQTTIGNNSKSDKNLQTTPTTGKKISLGDFNDEQPYRESVVQRANNSILLNGQTTVSSDNKAQNAFRVDGKTTDGDGITDPKAATGITQSYDRFRDYAGAAAQNSVPRTEMPTIPSPVETPAIKGKDANVLKEEPGRLSKLEEKENKQVGFDKNSEKNDVLGESKLKTTRGVTIPVKTPATPADIPPAVTPNVSATTTASGTVTSTTSAAPITVTGGTYSTYSTGKTTVYSPDQILKAADSHFKQKKYTNAAAQYTQFSNLETSGKRHDRALFQAATCYTRLNRKAEAKAIFETLSTQSGAYKQAAKKALKRL